jgi:hypothetical protein
MPTQVDDALRARIETLLSGALNVPWTRRALTQARIDGAIRELQELPRNELVGKLVIGGFTLSPYLPPDDVDGIEHSCATCMYYERHRRFCNLPELMLPVEPQWSCILWRI